MSVSDTSMCLVCTHGAVRCARCRALKPPLCDRTGDAADTLSPANPARRPLLPLCDGHGRACAWHLVGCMSPLRPVGRYFGCTVFGLERGEPEGGRRCYDQIRGIGVGGGREREISLIDHCAVERWKVAWGGCILDVARNEAVWNLL